MKWGYKVKAHKNTWIICKKYHPFSLKLSGLVADIAIHGYREKWRSKLIWGKSSTKYFHRDFQNIEECSSHSPSTLLKADREGVEMICFTSPLPLRGEMCAHKGSSWRSSNSMLFTISTNLENKTKQNKTVSDTQ